MVERFTYQMQVKILKDCTYFGSIGKVMRVDFEEELAGVLFENYPILILFRFSELEEVKAGADGE